VDVFVDVFLLVVVFVLVHVHVLVDVVGFSFSLRLCRAEPLL